MVCSPHRYQLGMIANGFYAQSRVNYENLKNSSSYIPISSYQLKYVNQFQNNYLQRDIKNENMQYYTFPQSQDITFGPKNLNLESTLFFPEKVFKKSELKEEDRETIPSLLFNPRNERNIKLYIPLHYDFNYQKQTKENLRNSLTEKIQKELLELKKQQQVQYVYN